MRSGSPPRPRTRCRPTSTHTSSKKVRSGLIPTAQRSSSAMRPPSIPRPPPRSEEHTSELQSLMRISYAVFCSKKKQHQPTAAIGHEEPTAKYHEPTHERKPH